MCRLSDHSVLDQSWTYFPSNRRVPSKPVIRMVSKTDLYPDPAGLVCMVLGITLAVDSLLRGGILWVIRDAMTLPDMVLFPRGMIVPTFGCSSSDYRHLRQLMTSVFAMHIIGRCSTKAVRTLICRWQCELLWWEIVHQGASKWLGVTLKVPLPSKRSFHRLA
jgi:hypothetical protein